MRNSRIKPVSAVIGTAFVASLASVSHASVADNPFGAEELVHGYQILADAHEGEDKDAEGKCGEGKCGEGKCGEGDSGETES